MFLFTGFSDVLEIRTSMEGALGRTRLPEGRTRYSRFPKGKDPVSRLVCVPLGTLRERLSNGIILNADAVSTRLLGQSSVLTCRLAS